MFYLKAPAAHLGRSYPRNTKLVVLFGLLFLPGLFSSVSAQSYHTELDTSEKISLTVKSRSGRVSVIASDELKGKVTIEASSTGALVGATDLKTEAKGGNLNIEVRDRRDKDRIDLIVRIPSRSKVKVDTQAGSVDIVGNVESAEVSTNTETIHADVPLDAVKFDFVWSASKPRYLSDVELPKIKEKAAGISRISGKLGEKKPGKKSA